MFEALGIDIVSLAWQIVAFVALIFLLNRMLFKPIRKTLDERATHIQESMQEAERIKEQAVQADEQYQSRIQEAHQQAQEIMGQAREQARQEREGLLEQAQQDAQQYIRDARVQLEMEQRDMARAARQQVAGLAVLAAGRLIGETLDPEKHQELVEREIKALAEPLQELEQALRGLSDRQVGIVEVKSALELEESTQARIRSLVVQHVGHEVEMSFQTRSTLIGGFVLQIGDQVIDLSVVRKLGDLFREMSN
ncbi:MAG: F0F1 ATP synthase subunit B [Chloroflexia bacterium]|nr:F0F1 ATP synthase subunit B [Chloroflexia bacterium]